MKTLLIALFLLTACGKEKPPAIQCSWSTENTNVLNLGPLEKAKCPPDEFILSYEPQYLAGGEISHVLVQCGRRLQTCKAVNQ